MKKVIDADKMVILEHFEESDTDAILKRYENMCLWLCVYVDDETGNVILWKE